MFIKLHRTNRIAFFPYRIPIALVNALILCDVTINNRPDEINRSVNRREYGVTMDHLDYVLNRLESRSDFGSSVSDVLSFNR